jgi:pimeloyl-ACP methyl ester carboxylesterase
MPVEYQLVTLTAADGHQHDALFVIDERAARRRMRMTGRRTALMHVHGIMGNFLVGTLRFLPAPLAREGFPVLIVETRMGNIGQLVGPGIFDLARQDLTAGADWLRYNGWDHLISMGYSSGASLSARWAATEHIPWLRGLALLGAPWGLPEAMEKRATFWGALPTYDEIYARAVEVINDPTGADADRLFVVEHSRGPSAQPKDSEIYTYRTWWHSRGPEASAAKTHLQIAQVRAPLLLIQGTSDDVVDPPEVEQLAEVARGGGNDSVTIEMIEGADHFFAGREFVTIQALIRWLREHA